MLDHKTTAIMTRGGGCDVAVVGAGIAGLLAAARLRAHGASVILINTPVPRTPSGLGGFAPFSGAKFSLFPAGRGLAPLVGGEYALRQTYADVLSFLAASHVDKFQVSAEALWGNERSINPLLWFRKYHSIVLTPLEMRDLISYLRASLGNIQIISSEVRSIEANSQTSFSLAISNSPRVFAHRIVAATGRLGAGLLAKASVPETEGKGVDFGVRLEFSDDQPLKELRAEGPDAKILGNGVRTFCLNSPGKIFHYSALGVEIPGGIVADGSVQSSNVGILCRLANKREALDEFKTRMQQLRHEGRRLSFVDSNPGFAHRDSLRALLPSGVAERVHDFTNHLISAQLLDLPQQFLVHYPLIDWHWPVFAQPGRLETAIKGLYAVGDLSGHARGLLQAATMGWLAAEEALA